MANGNGELFSWQQVASGLTAVRAQKNTRQPSLMPRTETKSMAQRVHGWWSAFSGGGGYVFLDADLKRREISAVGYKKDVSMGADLTAPPVDGQAPTFLVAALRDPIGANLDRVQIVKGRLDAEGKSREKSMISRDPETAKSRITASCPPLATQSMRRRSNGPTRSAWPGWFRSGLILISMRINVCSTTPAYSKFRHRRGTSMTWLIWPRCA